MDPVLTITAERVREADAAASLLVFRFTLSEPATEQITVSFETADGTAIAGEDYEAITAGQLIFEPDDQELTLAVVILADETAEADETFDLNILTVEGAQFDVLTSPIVATIEDDDTSVTLTGTEDSDTLVGGADPEKIIGLGAGDSLVGNEGGDELVGGEGGDILEGGAGIDTLFGNGGDDELYGGDDADSLLGGGGADLIVGGAGDDTANGGTENDTLLGDEGSDKLVGGPGSDFLLGGIGDDTLQGGDQADELIGEEGRDNLDGGPGADTIDGGLDADTINGGAAADSILGDAGDDVILAGEGFDTIHGGDGNDDLDAGPGDDIVTGADGDDTVNAGSGNDDVTLGLGNNVAFGFAGADRLEGGDGNDSLEGGDGLDTLLGAFGDDTLAGGPAADLIVGSGGNDDAHGGFGDDTISGDDGNDTIAGADGADLITGNFGDDSLRGGAGSDTIEGAAGDDWISGAEAADDLDGGDGNDTIFGGDGNDTIDGGVGFDMLSGDRGNDTILYAYNAGEGEFAVVDGGLGNEDSFVFTVAERVLNDLGLSAADVQARFDAGVFGVDPIDFSELGFTLLSIEQFTLDLVEPFNTAPDPEDDAVTTAFETEIEINLFGDNGSGFDGDPDGDLLTVTGVTDPANGTVVDTGDGHVVYTPDAAFSGIDTFVYTVSDGFGGTADATVTVTVNASTNTDPTPQDDAASTDYETALTIDLFADNGNGVDSDPEGDPLTVTALSDPANGTVADTGGGTVLYTPDAGFTGDDTFTYTVEDGNGGTADATVTVSVAPRPNTDPTPQNDAVVTAYETALSIDLFADNGSGPDSDPEGDPLTVTVLSDPANGTVSDTGSGTALYTPDAGFTGEDTFTYTVEDGFGGTADATVTVTVEDALPVGAILVDTTADTVAEDGFTSFREAVTQAGADAGDNTILFDLAAGSVITLSLGDVTIDSALTVLGDVDGDGKADITLSGTGADRVLTTTASGVVLEAIEISGGGGVATGGGILNSGTLTILDSTIADNSSTSSGGGIQNDGTLNMSGSYVSGNTTGNDGGGIFNTDTATIVNTTIANNHADVVGGGYGNSAQGGPVGSAVSTFRNVTITANTADDFAGGVGNSATLNVYNSIIAGNLSPDGGNPEFAQFGAFTGGGNILGQSGFGGTNLFVDAADVDDIFEFTTALGGGDLGGLAADNGGPTLTVALKSAASNLALDAGLDAEALGLGGGALATDQRGEGFARIADLGDVPSENGTSAVDIGAFELQITEYIV